MSKLLSIYVGMALTHAPDEFRVDFHNALKTNLRALQNVTVRDFFWVSTGQEAGSNTEVFRTDCRHVEEADLCIFIPGYPSDGLGAEMFYRIKVLKKPVIVSQPIGARVSRFTLGLCESHGIHVSLHSSHADIVEQVRAWRNY